MLRVRVGPDHFLESKLPAMPYTRGNAAIVVLGDDYWLTGDLQDGALVNLRHVPASSGPNMLHVKFASVPEGVGSILFIESTFGDILRYRALARSATGTDFVPTSTCPIMKLATEHWPDPVVGIIIANVRVNDPKDMGCH
jgi:hypothetical protein